MWIRKYITLTPLENVILMKPEVVGLHPSNPQVIGLNFDKVNYSEIVTNMWNLITFKKQR